MTRIVVLGCYAHDVYCFYSVPVRDPVVSKRFQIFASSALEPILDRIHFLAYNDVLHSYLIVPQTLYLLCA